MMWIHGFAFFEEGVVDEIVGLRFVDSNVLLHAFLEPRRKLTLKELRVKQEAQAIVKD